MPPGRLEHGLEVSFGLRLPVANRSPFDTEYRRRVWSYVYHAEKQ